MALHSSSHRLIVGTVRAARPWAGFIALILVLSTTACGQKGGLYLPTEPAARDRATLPQVLLPTTSSAPTSPASASR